MRLHYGFLFAAAIMAGVPPIAQTGTISTVAGAGDTADGVAATRAGLSDPVSGIFDAAGNLYIAEYWDSRIRKIDAVTGIISTVAGTGVWGYNGDGMPAMNAQLNGPVGLAFDASGNLYIADCDNSRIRKIDSATGIISTVAGVGVWGYNGDGILATNAQLRGPKGIDFDSSGNLHIADGGNDRIRRVDAFTGLISTVGGTGTGGYNGDGILATDAQINNPVALVFSISGDYFISDSYNYRVRKVDAATGLISTVAGTGTYGYNGDGILATSASLYYPYGIFLDASVNLYIADRSNNRIRKVDSMTGLISTVAGTGTAAYNGEGIVATSAHLHHPCGIVLDDEGGMHIADTNNLRMRKVDAATNIISAEAGIYWEGYSEEDVSAMLAYLYRPMDVAFDRIGNMYIADTFNHRIRKVDAATGIIRTVAGTGTAGYSGDGISATSAQVSEPNSIALDALNNLYIADTSNHRIRKVDAATGLISTVAGTGTGGYNGDGIEATTADLKNPRGIAFYDSGDLLIADSGNSRIRKVSFVTGLINTVAGTDTVGYNGDGISATGACLNQPRRLAVDSKGNFYIADMYNNRIRRVDAVTGLISTVAGTGVHGYYGDGMAAINAYLDQPEDIDFDGSGNLYIAEYSNSRIRKIDAVTGIISTVAGTWEIEYNGDGIEATEANINRPSGIALDRYGNLYIADTYNNRIRRVIPSPASPGIAIGNRVAKGAISAAPNILRPSSRRNLVIHMNGDPNASVEVEIYDEVGGFIGALETVLDGNGYGQAVIQGGRVDGKLLAPGAYWALVKGGGVNDKKRFMVAR